MATTKRKSRLSQSQRRLAAENMALAHWCVQRAVVPSLGNSDLDDWSAMALWVLTKAAKHYDPNYRTKTGQKVKFGTYATNAIMRGLYDAMRKKATDAGLAKTHQGDDEFWEASEALAVYDDEPDDSAEVLANLFAKAQLTDRETEVLRLVFWSKWTHEMVSKKYRISKERVRQIKVRAIWKLRDAAGVFEPAA